MGAGTSERGPGVAVLLVSFAAGLVGADLFARGRFLAGSALIAASVVLLRWPGRIWDVAEPVELSRRARLLALLAVVAIGAFFRFYRLDPPGLWGDDAINGMLAFEVLDGKVTSPFQLVQHSISRMHALTNFLIAGSFLLFGPDLWTLRLPGVVLNLLCVPLVYLLFKPLFRGRAALCAALFFATSPMQLSHAKILIQVATGQFLLLLALCLAIRGLSGRRAWLIALAGVPLGLSLCTYHSYKVDPLIALFAVFAGLSVRQAPTRRIGWWLAAGVLVTIAAAAPGMLAYVDDPGALTGRLGNTSSWSGGFASAWDSIWRTLTIFHYQQGPRGVHWVGVGSDPAFGIALALLACHGLVQSLRRVREPRHLFLLAWFGIGLLPGLLSSEAPRVYRVLLATPPVFLWAALPVERLLAWARSGAGEARTAGRWAAAALAALVLVLQPVADFDYYFHRVYTHYDYQWTQGSRMVEMARLLRARGAGWSGALLAEGYNATHDTMRFLSRAWSLDLHDIASLSEIVPQRAEGNTLLLFDASSAGVLESIRSFYPGAEAEIRYQPPQRAPWLELLLGSPPPGAPRILAASLGLPAEVVAARRGLEVQVSTVEGALLASHVGAQLAFQATEDEPAGADHAAFHGALFAPREGSYSFSLEGELPASVRLDGRPLLSTEHRQTSLDLAEGLHAVEALVQLAPGGSFEVRWRPPGAAEGSIPRLDLWRWRDAGGWLAEYQNPARRVRRLEAIPWYSLFPRNFDGRYDVRWRGRLRVPDGGRHLELRSRSQMAVLVDGRAADPGELLRPGDHEIDVALRGLDGPQSLVIQWREPHGAAILVPPSAFLPPSA